MNHPTDSPLVTLPPPTVIHRRIGALLRELALLRRLKRLAEAAREQRAYAREPEEVRHAK